MSQYNRDELYHSEIYLGKDYSNGVKHFKYIKREMKNGRWVYYYSNDLEKQRDILKDNIKYQKNMIKNNKTYKNPITGKTFGPNHYKKAIKYDQKDLEKINKKISKQSKIEKNASKTAVKVANTVSDTKYKAKVTVDNIIKKYRKKK